MPDTTRIVSDGCLYIRHPEERWFEAVGRRPTRPRPDLSAFAGNPLRGRVHPGVQGTFGTAPLSVFHAHAFDAVNVLFAAISNVAIQNDDGSLEIPRQALRDAVFATSGYQGLTGTITCTPLGDCATDVTIGVFKAPAWPVEGGTGDKAVFSDTKSLDDVFVGGRSKKIGPRDGRSIRSGRRLAVQGTD